MGVGVGMVSACNPNLRRYVPYQKNWFLSFLGLNMGHRCRHFALKVLNLKLKESERSK